MGKLLCIGITLLHKPINSQLDKCVERGGKVGLYVTHVPSMVASDLRCERT